MKTKKNQVNLGEALKLFFQENGLEERVLQSLAIDAWHAQMGDFMKQFTTELYVKKKVLYVRLNSPAFKSELSYGKSKILTHIHEYMDSDYIKDVVFL